MLGEVHWGIAVVMPSHQHASHQSQAPQKVSGHFGRIYQSQIWLSPGIGIGSLPLLKCYVMEEG